MNETLLPLVRHVPTRFNAGGTGKERSRGWLTVPPDQEQLQQMSPRIAAQLARLNVGHLVSSDLPRAAVTAKWLGKQLGIPVETTRQLRTWNTGDLAGKLETETLPQRKKFISYPDTKPPGGEPFEEFLARVGPALRRWARYNDEHADAPAAVVVHGHMALAAPAVFTGEDVDPDELDKLDELYPPGSVLLLRIRGDRVTLETVAHSPAVP